MNAIALKEIIQNGTRDLPMESLKEVADFVLFLRAKLVLGSQPSETALTEWLSRELMALSKAETSHLEAEFENYQNQYPLEQVRH